MIKEGSTIMASDNDYEYGPGIEKDLSEKHKMKVAQLKSMLDDLQEEFISYTLLQLGDSMDNAISVLMTEEKDYHLRQFTLLEKAKRESMLQDTNNIFSQPHKTIDLGEMLRNTLSSRNDLYASLLRLLQVKNKDLNGSVWQLLRMMPINEHIRDKVEKAFFADPSTDIKSEGVITKSSIIENPLHTLSSFYTELLCKSLEDKIQRKDIDSLIEFCINESGVQIIELLFGEKLSLIITQFLELCKREGPNNIVLWEMDDKLVVNDFGLLSTLLRVHQLILDICLNSDQYNNQKVKLSYAALNGFMLDSLLNAVETDETYSLSLDAVSDIAISIFKRDDLKELYLRLCREIGAAVQQNIFNFAENPGVLDVFSSCFQMIIKWTFLEIKLGNSTDTDFIDEILYMFMNSESKSSVNILGNLVLLYVSYFPETSQSLSEKLLERVSINGYHQPTSRSIFELTNSILRRSSKYKEEYLGKTRKSSEKNLELVKENEEKEITRLVSYLNALPSSSTITENNLNQIINSNFEGIMEIQKIIIESFSIIDLKVSDELIEKLFSEHVRPNLSQLYTEEPTVFYKCVSRGESSLKARFFDIAIQFCKFNWKYSLEVFGFLSNVYEVEDFKNDSNKWIGIRNGDDPIGIKNLGCTCYANSLFQMLFNNENIRNNIMSSQPDPENADHQVLLQVKNLFWNLMYSRKNCGMLNEFCTVFTGFDGEPINVRVQQDANEFFNLLVEILQSQAKESQRDDEKVDFLKDEYGGNILNKIRSCEPEYPYDAGNSEPFLTVPLTIKNMGSIFEALDEFCTEEIFDGDNKLTIDKYNKKITVAKHSIIGNLPPTLIFNLKRFEYNMQVFERYKLNDHFEFPMEIDLSPWVSEEAKRGNTQYELKGVLVHSGSAAAGHYYSFIKKDGKWIEFNDTTVKEFIPNEETLVKQWFGNKKKEHEVESNGLSIMFNQNSFDSSASAYMLFYEQLGTSNNMSTEINKNKAYNDYMTQIEAENRSFIRSKIFMDGISLRFIEDLITVMTTQSESLLQALYAQLMDSEDELSPRPLALLKSSNSSYELLKQLSTLNPKFEEHLPSAPFQLVKLANSADLSFGSNHAVLSNTAEDPVFNMRDDDIQAGWNNIQGNGVMFDSFEEENSKRAL